MNKFSLVNHKRLLFKKMIPYDPKHLNSNLYLQPRKCLIFQIFKYSETMFNSNSICTSISFF